MLLISWSHCCFTKVKMSITEDTFTNLVSERHNDFYVDVVASTRNVSNTVRCIYNMWWLVRKMFARVCGCRTEHRPDFRGENRVTTRLIHLRASSSIDSTTLGGSWSVQQFYSSPLYPPLSLSNQWSSSSLDPPPPGPSTLTWVSQLALLYMESILLFSWWFLFSPFALHELPILIFVILYILLYHRRA